MSYFEKSIVKYRGKMKKPSELQYKAEVLGQLFEEKHKMTFGDRYPYVLKTGRVMTINDAIGYGELLLSDAISPLKP